MSQPAQKDSPQDRRRQEMLWAASDVFTAFGFDLADMQAIADSAGVTKATLYAHVGEKEQIFRAVIEYWLEELPEPKLSCLTLSAPTSNVIVTAYRCAHGALLPPVREHLP